MHYIVHTMNTSTSKGLRTITLFMLIIICYWLAVDFMQIVRLKFKQHEKENKAPADETMLLTQYRKANDTVISDDETKHGFVKETKQKSQMNKITQDRVRVVVFTAFRSGSSFAGSLFFNNPEVFYMFEPLAIIKKYLNAVYETCESPYHVCAIRKLLNCAVTEVFYDASQIDPKKNHQKNSWIARVFYKTIKKYGITYNNQSLFDELCLNKYKSSAMKIIRGVSIEDLIPLMEEGVKVLHIIRDPRAVARSRTQYRNWNSSQTMTDIQQECSKNVMNINFLISSSNLPKLASTLQNNYRVIRMEDLSSNLVAMSQVVYDFLGMKMPEIVYNITHINPKVDSHHGGVKLGITDRIISKTGSKLKSTPVTYSPKWTTDFDSEFISKIEKVCNRFMESLHYEVYKPNLEVNLTYVGRAPRYIPYLLSL